MSRRKTIVSGVLGLTLLLGGAVTVVLDFSHAPDSPAIHLPTGPRAIESSGPHHTHEERQSGPPESVKAPQFATRSAVNVAGEVNVEGQSVQPLVLLVLLAAFLVVGKHLRRRRSAGRSRISAPANGTEEKWTSASVEMKFV